MMVYAVGLKFATRWQSNNVNVIVLVEPYYIRLIPTKFVVDINLPFSQQCLLLR